MPRVRRRWRACAAKLLATICKSRERSHRPCGRSQMSADDIIKAREGLCKLLEAVLKFANVEAIADARKSLAAFERLVAEPAPSVPQIPLRAYIAAQIAASLAGATDFNR